MKTVGNFAAWIVWCAVTIAGCTKTAPNEPAATFFPTLTILSPKTGDTLFLGLQKISYTLDGQSSVAFMELFVNDSLRQKTPPNPDGSIPGIAWPVDSSLLGSRIRYYLKAYDIDRNSVTSPVMTDLLVAEPPNPPSAPTHLSLWRLSPTAVNLMWQLGGSGAQSLEVWRKSSSTSYRLIQRLPQNVISANDSGLTPGTDYWYKVRAVNGYGFAESGEVTTAVDSNATSSPSALRASPLGTKQVQLQWVDNSTNELSFIVQRQLSGTGVYAVVGMAGPNSTSYTDSNGLQAGGSYIYRVAAQGPRGSSAWSNEAAVTTLFQDIYPPTDLSAIYDVSSRGVILNWKDNSVLTIQTWIERKIDSTVTFVNLGRVGTGIAAFADSAVTPGHRYTYRVRIFTAQGYFSLYSNEASLTVPTTSISGLSPTADEIARPLPRRKP